MKEFVKHRIIRTQNELESHINNVFKVFDRNIKAYVPKNMLDVG